MNNLALLYAAKGRYSEAEPLFLKTLAILRRVLPEGYPLTRGADELPDQILPRRRPV